MKKYIHSIAAALLTTAALSANTYAAPSAPLIVSETAGADVKSNIFEEDINSYDFLFGTSDVEIMYEYAIPYYMYNSAVSYKELSDIYSFTGNYFVPVSSSSGNFIGFAEYSLTNNGEWEIISTSSGDYYTGLYKSMLDNSLYSGYSSAFLVGDALFNELGIVFDSDTDIYFDYTAYFADTSSASPASIEPSYDNYFINGNAKMNEVIKQSAIITSGEGGSSNDTEDELSGQESTTEKNAAGEPAAENASPETGHSHAVRTAGVLCAVGTALMLLFKK